jgi:hypothetical protein
MKNTNKVLLAVAVAASFALSNRAMADDQVFLSPRAKDNQTTQMSRTKACCPIPGMKKEAPVAQGQMAPVGSPRAQAQQPPPWWEAPRTILTWCVNIAPLSTPAGIPHAMRRSSSLKSPR